MFAPLTDLLRKPAVPSSLLLPPPAFVANNKSAARPEVLRWLDDQPPKSAIYVALGCEAPLTLQNLRELALGLELSGVRFLWALWRPAGMFSPGADAAGELLPAGFEGRTSGRGAVRMGWVPQVEVLAHAAVGAFLTHCGWGSLVESFVFGHPLVMLPFVVDQGLNAQAMAERAVGVEVARDENDGSFRRNGVAAVVRSVMVEGEGEVFASNAKKLRQEKYLDDLVECLRRYREA